MDYQSILNTIEQKLDKRNCKGKVAAYIPELAKVPADKLGMHLYCIKVLIQDHLDPPHH